MQRVGYGVYASQQLRPYLRAAASQFSPSRATVTDRVVAKLRRLRSTRNPLNRDVSR
jgi:hypothetical protein